MKLSVMEGQSSVFCFVEVKIGFFEKNILCLIITQTGRGVSKSITSTHSHTNTRKHTQMYHNTDIVCCNKEFYHESRKLNYIL